MGSFFKKIWLAVAYFASEFKLKSIIDGQKMGKVVWHGDESRMVGICYEDAAGKETTRTVAIKAVTIDFDRTRAFLHAFCLDRGELRSFRVDRVKDIFDEHGEILDKKRFLQEVGIKKPGSFNF